MKKDKNILTKLNIRKPGFKVPDNYFKIVENSLKNQKHTKNAGFKVPKTYFKDFEEKIRTKVISTKNTGFKVPENYFENMDVNSILKSQKPKKIFKLNPYKILGFSIAASLLLFFGLNNMSQNSSDLIFSTINQNDISNWVDEGLVSFNIYDIEDAFTDTDINLAVVNNDEIYNYLEDVDIESLIIEE